jgi:ribosomal protein S18 acetylase RimI-like enzyme
VDPYHQGHGLGSTLLAYRTTRCDTEGLPAYLEATNPRNISLYRRHGFEVMGEIRSGDAPPLTPMHRPPRR